jgi:hypothetical protein
VNENLGDKRAIEVAIYFATPLLGASSGGASSGGASSGGASSGGGASSSVVVPAVVWWCQQ